MTNMPVHKYRAYAPIILTDRQWPSRIIDKAPIWCSVDLRDGNQALVEPMGVDRKMRMFDLSRAWASRRSKSPFPPPRRPISISSARSSRTAAIPDGVAIQVLTQCRAELIERTFEAVKGAKKVIVHFYNSTSTLQREVVFRSTAPACARSRSRGEADQGARRGGAGDRIHLRIFARELHRHRARILPRDLRGGDGGLRPTPRKR